jgi:Reverse transcriptase (RNA-dependent DNA polymerase)
VGLRRWFRGEQKPCGLPPPTTLGSEIAALGAEFDRGGPVPEGPPTPPGHKWEGARGRVRGFNEFSPSTSVPGKRAPPSMASLSERGSDAESEYSNCSDHSVAPKQDREAVPAGGGTTARAADCLPEGSALVSSPRETSSAGQVLGGEDPHGGEGGEDPQGGEGGGREGGSRVGGSYVSLGSKAQRCGFCQKPGHKDTKSKPCPLRSGLSGFAPREITAPPSLTTRPMVTQVVVGGSSPPSVGSPINLRETLGEPSRPSVVKIVTVGPRGREVKASLFDRWPQEELDWLVEQDPMFLIKRLGGHTTSQVRGGWTKRWGHLVKGALEIILEASHPLRSAAERLLLLLPSLVLAPGQPGEVGSRERGMRFDLLDKGDLRKLVSLTEKRSSAREEWSKRRRAVPVGSDVSHLRRAVRLAGVGEYSRAATSLIPASVAEADDKVLTTLRELHPPAARQVVGVPGGFEWKEGEFARLLNDTPGGGGAEGSVGRKELRGAMDAVLRSFKREAASGPSGWRTEHILASMPVARQQWEDLNAHLLNGSALLSDYAWSALRCARLIPLRKPEGGIRPIAIGEAIRRFVASVALRLISQKQIADALPPMQYGAGTRWGTQKFARLAESYLSSSSEEEEDKEDPRVLLSIDCRNAFNCVHRQSILEQTHKRIPALYPLVWALYSGEPELVLRKGRAAKDLVSREGTMQGDPLGPLLFCLAFAPAMESLSSFVGDKGGRDSFVAAYADDMVIGTTLSRVSATMKEAEASLAEVGLSVQRRKCKVVSFTKVEESTLPDEWRDLWSDSLVLGGVPVGTPQFKTLHVREKRKESKKLLTEALKLPLTGIEGSVQCSFDLVRLCILPKTTHLLQVVGRDEVGPSEVNEIEKCSTQARTAILSLLGAKGQHDSVTSRQVTSRQMSLPIKEGGLGLADTWQVAEAAYAATGMECLSDLVRLGRAPASEGDLPWVQRAQEYLDRARATFDEWKREKESRKEKSFPTSSIADLKEGKLPMPTQRFLTKLAGWKIKKNLLSDLFNNKSFKDAARILSASGSLASAWLVRSAPSTMGGNSAAIRPMKNDDFVIALTLRLGLELEHLLHVKGRPCWRCRLDINDGRGFHALVCQKGPGARILRHDGYRQAVAGILRQMGAVVREEVNLRELGLDGAKPGDRMDIVALMPRGREVHVDTTVRVPATSGHERHDGATPGAAAERGAKDKVSTYGALYGDSRSSTVFLPWAVEVYGMGTPRVDSFLKEAATGAVIGREGGSKSLLSSSQLSERAGLLRSWRRTLAVRLQEGNAAAIRLHASRSEREWEKQARVIML